MNIEANITGIKYTPTMCESLKEYNDIYTAISTGSSILNINSSKIALSVWVSPKRTRSYPYARVYDTLSFCGKKITIIPVVKDEGLNGDRDFLQWDTISMMSLLGIYVVISYYTEAEKNKRYTNKITSQQFDTKHIYGEIIKILSYQSDALHWNLNQTENISDIFLRAISNYKKILKKLNVIMNSEKSAL